eukprot:2246277-Karenia_brevis.AAC.1
MPRLWCKWVRRVFRGSPVMHAFDLASSENTLAAEGPQLPPSASTTNGMKEIPADWQSNSVLLWLRLKCS